MKKLNIAVITLALSFAASGSLLAEKPEPNADPKRCEATQPGDGEAHQDEARKNKDGCKHHTQTNKEGNKHTKCGEKSASNC